MAGCGDKCEQGKSIHDISKPRIGHVEKQAAVGFTSDGDKYDMYRPSYTDESVDLIVSEILSLPRTSLTETLKYDVLELGAGTGKMTEQLSKKLPDNARYLASDMSENFLDVLKVKGLNVRVTQASADSIPLEEKTVGSVVCAQCFHWFSEKTDLESIHRVLVPGGKLILIWNMRDFSAEWLTQLRELRDTIFMKVQGSHKYDISSMEWRRELDVSPLFRLQWHKSMPGVTVQGDLDAVMASLTTSSLYKALPPDERDVYLDQFRTALRNVPGIDPNNITIPYRTDLYVYSAE